MRGLTLALTLMALAGCHWLFPHSPAPGSLEDRHDRSRNDASRDRPAPRDRLTQADGPRDRSLEAKVQQRDTTGLADLKLTTDKKYLDGKPVPDGKPADAKPADTQPPDGRPKLDGGPCATWPWSCVDSPSWCKAWCGGAQIDCLTGTGCKCTNGKVTACAAAFNGYCGGCQQAFQSGCCN